MKKCVVIRTDHLGDLLLTTPLFHALATAGYAVEAVVSQKLMAILENNPDLVGVHSWQKISQDFPSRWWMLGSWLRKQKYDLIILPYARPKELLWASAISGIPRKIAMWSGLWGRLTGHQAIRSGADRQLQHMSEIILKSAHCLGLPATDTRAVLVLTEEERERASLLLQTQLSSGKYIGVHPGSLGNACNLPPSVYGQLVERFLRETDYKVVITGSVNEAGLMASWPEEVRSSPRVWNSMGQLAPGLSDLRMLAAVISRLQLLIVPSTGPLQLAAALNIPTVSPFCSSKYRCAKIYGSKNGRVLSPSLMECDAWQSGHQGYCDFRGEVTADKLFELAMEVLSAGCRD